MLLNESLTEEVDDFLSSRQQWVEEFDRQIEVVKYFTSYILHCTMYIYCTIGSEVVSYTLHCTLYIVHFKLYNVQYCTIVVGYILYILTCATAQYLRNCTITLQC